MFYNPSHDRPPRYEETEEYRLKKEAREMLDPEMQKNLERLEHADRRYQQRKELYKQREKLRAEMEVNAKKQMAIEHAFREYEDSPQPGPPPNAGLNPPTNPSGLDPIFAEYPPHEAELRRRARDCIRENTKSSTEYFHRVALGETVTLGNGAKQARILGRFDLIPFEVWQNVAMVLETGVAKYGVDNWRGIPYEDHVNHLMYHAGKSLTDDTSEDHLIHAICRAMFAWTVAQRVHSV